MASWRKMFSMVGAFHGGGFWEAIGEQFDSLERANAVINADVLDAWFDPAPGVTKALGRNLAWCAKTSPPTHGRGLETALARALDLSIESVMVGAGSSALIYLALGRWLSAGSKVLIPEPTYGEYAHFCENVVGCKHVRFLLGVHDGFRLDLAEWSRTLRDGEYDLAILVNPNNPTGEAIRSSDLAQTLKEIPSSTRVIVDEAYFDYVREGAPGRGPQSLTGQLRDLPRNVFVLKSLSKGLALSGLRVAYLAGHPDEIRRLRLHSPPWSVSLPAQIAAVAAMGDRAYYERRYRETDLLRARLACGLLKLGFEPPMGAANWLLCRVPSGIGCAPELVRRAASRGLFLRDAGATAPSLGANWIRIAIKDGPTQARMLEILGEL